MGNDVLKIQSEICSKAPPLKKKNELLKKLPVGFKAVFYWQESFGFLSCFIFFRYPETGIDKGERRHVKNSS